MTFYFFQIHNHKITYIHVFDEKHTDTCFMFLHPRFCRGVDNVRLNILKGDRRHIMQSPTHLYFHTSTFFYWPHIERSFYFNIFFRIVQIALSAKLI